jgi:tetrahydromethanopterin S-methyltransferase subunit F
MNLMNATDIFLKRKNELEEEYKSLVQTPNSPSKNLITAYIQDIKIRL